MLITVFGLLVRLLGLDQVTWTIGRKFQVLQLLYKMALCMLILVGWLLLQKLVRLIQRLLFGVNLVVKEHIPQEQVLPSQEHNLVLQILVLPLVLTAWLVLFLLWLLMRKGK